MLVAATSGAFALAAPSAQAAWSLLDNFDSYSAGPTTTATGGSWTSVFDGTGNSNVVASDKVLSLETKGGAAWRGAKKDITGTAGIAAGTTGTIFFQFKPSSAGGAFDVMMGLSPSISTIDDSNAWQDFNVMPFFAGAGDGTADLKVTTPADGDINLITDATLDVWYNVWLVVDNDLTAPSFDVFTSTGTAAGSFAGTGAYVNTGGAGLGIGQDLNAIGFMAAGGADSAVLHDNIYYTSGVDTTNPVPEPSVAILGGLGILGLLRRRR